MTSGRRWRAPLGPRRRHARHRWPRPGAPAAQTASPSGTGSGGPRSCRRSAPARASSGWTATAGWPSCARSTARSSPPPTPSCATSRLLLPQTPARRPRAPRRLVRGQGRRGARGRRRPVVAAPHNGAEAVGVVVAEQPDLVLVEDVLPMLSGADVVRELRPARRPRWSRRRSPTTTGSHRCSTAGARAAFLRLVPPAEVARGMLALLARPVGDPGRLTGAGDCPVGPWVRPRACQERLRTAHPPPVPATPSVPALPARRRPAPAPRPGRSRASWPSPPPPAGSSPEAVRRGPAG